MEMGDVGIATLEVQTRTREVGNRICELQTTWQW
jgi:hypothetical protein